ncbi:uncharacterized protein AMSG_10690 [Thecamonas trahens ATCC 50062]|uniref:Uncharacterized protein n=1 Tax=Thecamonas trahens ATCC 50062 TaxID=461836 RepID=A0A0L0DUG7_THETB|nr:hypothetical protein AMSG_10690 [Thecamonas trahens ATCC 50062]KNC55093.1 hypothetical protein AMSG_10690 [Thecamonas trahens ATCC 50062]|eukprot:XP_013753277.1 hypothetical protein AMSG_10690 [Thecamonas trahens ATCC 50062]
MPTLTPKPVAETSLSPAATGLPPQVPPLDLSAALPQQQQPVPSPPVPLDSRFHDSDATRYILVVPDDASAAAESLATAIADASATLIVGETLGSLPSSAVVSLPENVTSLALAELLALAHELDALVLDDDHAAALAEKRAVLLRIVELRVQSLARGPKLFTLSHAELKSVVDVVSSLLTSHPPPPDAPRPHLAAFRDALLARALRKLTSRLTAWLAAHRDDHAPALAAFVASGDLAAAAPVTPRLAVTSAMRSGSPAALASLAMASRKAALRTPPSGAGSPRPSPPASPLRSATASSASPSSAAAALAAAKAARSPFEAFCAAMATTVATAKDGLRALTPLSHFGELRDVVGHAAYFAHPDVVAAGVGSDDDGAAAARVACLGSRVHAARKAHARAIAMLEQLQMASFAPFATATDSLVLAVKTAATLAHLAGRIAGAPLGWEDVLAVYVPTSLECLATSLVARTTAEAFPLRIDNAFR